MQVQKNTGSQDQNTPSQDSGSTGENPGEDQNTSDETGAGKDSEKMNEKSDDSSDKADAEKKDAEEKSSEETAKQADETTAKETLVTPTKEITGVEVLKNYGTSYGMFPITDATCTVKGIRLRFPLVPVQRLCLTVCISVQRQTRIRAIMFRERIPEVPASLRSRFRFPQRTVGFRFR